MAAAKFLLEHFYYGQPVRDGQPQGEARLLAASAGVSAELAALAVERVRLPAFSADARGTWALVRGRERGLPFLLVQAQQQPTGKAISHYIIAQPDALRAVGGNLQALAAVVEAQMPAFTQPGNTLPTLELASGEPLSVEAQIDDLLDLMTFTGNKTALIESLLGAIVQGVQLVVQGAPADLMTRLAFLEGLLALLPPSARFGVTFTTHSLPETDIDTQIRFYSDDAPPAGTLVYHWGEQRISGEAPNDDYSHYVLSQLRLDAELVIQRTAALTQVAGWRLNQGERLAEALGYASNRLKVDEALRNAQPVSKDEVGRILADDPTLTDDLRILYADHLIKFSLAMNDMAHAEPIALLLRANPSLERATLQQMEAALQGGQARLVYSTLAKWMANPLGPEGTEWVDLTHRVVLRLLRDLVRARAIDDVNALVQEMQETGPSVNIGRLVPQIIAQALPLNDAAVTENLFLLAVKLVDEDTFRKLLNTRAFLEALPLPVRRTWVVADDEIASTAPPGLLMNMARDFGSAWEAPVLLRFAEIARQKNRLDLIDAAALRGLAVLATSPEGGAYVEPLLRLADSFNDDALQALAAPGPDDLLQIRLALGDYDGLAKAMLKQSALLYRGEKQVEYIRVVERIFSETPLNEAVIGAALDGISRGGIKSVPYIVASVGLLKGQTPSQELDHVAEATVQLLMQDRLLLEAVPSADVLAVLNYFLQRKDVVGAIRAAALVPLSAAYQGSNGIRIMSQMYKLMGSDDKTRTAGLYMLRAFVREASDEEAQRAVVYFGRELGDSVARALETTYAFRSLMGGLDLLAYAERVHLAAEFLQATASAYMDARNTPTTGAITNVLDDLISSIAVGDRRLLSKTMVTLLKAVVLLGKQYRTNRPRDENRFVNRLLTGEADPRSALDVFKAMGGYFARGRRFDVTLGNASLRIFNERNGDDLRDSVMAAAALLEDLIRTLPLAKPPTLQTAEIRAEVESQWSQVEVEQQRTIVRDLANDLQRIVDIIVFLEANGDANVAEDTSAISKRLNSGRQRPKSTLELYRFMAAYFRARG